MNECDNENFFMSVEMKDEPRAKTSYEIGWACEKRAYATNSFYRGLCTVISRSNKNDNAQRESNGNFTK